MPHFPHTRLRRNRQTDWNRRLVQENDLSTNDFIWPLFVHEGEDISIPPINSLEYFQSLQTSKAVKS